MSDRKHGENPYKSPCIPCTKTQALNNTIDNGLDGLGIMAFALHGMAYEL